MAQMEDSRNSETTSLVEEDGLDSPISAAPGTVTLAQVNFSEELTCNRSQSVDSQMYHQGIYWPSPITMVSSFFVGVSMCLGHHLYYNSLIGEVVGDNDGQQRAIRSVSLFRASISF
jgi:hypothetical protein